MAYSSPLIISTTSLNPTFGSGGTIASVLTTSNVTGTCVAVYATYAVLLLLAPMGFAVAVQSNLTYNTNMFKSTYVRPDACGK